MSGQSLLNKLKMGALKVNEEKKSPVGNSEESGTRRTYTSLKETKFADCPKMAKHEEDSSLLTILKDFLYERDITYGDVIGQSKISYSTFYYMEENKKVNYEIFERIVNICGYNVSKMLFEKL